MIEAKLNELDAVWASLPELVRVFLGIRLAIQTRIYTIDPGTASTLLAELEQVAYDPDAVFYYSFVQAQAKVW